MTPSALRVALRHLTQQGKTAASDERLITQAAKDIEGAYESVMRAGRDQHDPLWDELRSAMFPARDMPDTMADIAKEMAGRVAHAHLTKSARRNDRALVKGIEKLLEEIRNILADDPDLGPGGKWYRDPVADVAIHSGKATERYGGGAVVLTYDGAGYDYFSPNADYHVSDRWRDKLDVIAKRLGYHSEDANSWSMAFYYD
ncbi:hypothetical protein N9917_03440 [Deltaproteobacteria bacterium]|nr:hypothetical protein [Deltaproteobacteria bacterium]